MNPKEQLAEIKAVIDANTRYEVALSVMVAALFIAGMFSVIQMLLNEQYVWSIPAAAMTFFLKWPIEKIWQLRQQNIALSMVPILLVSMPPAQAAEAVQRVMEKLFPVEGQNAGE